MMKFFFLFFLFIFSAALFSVGIWLVQQSEMFYIVLGAFNIIVNIFTMTICAIAFLRG